MALSYKRSKLLLQISTGQIQIPVDTYRVYGVIVGNVFLLPTNAYLLNHIGHFQEEIGILFSSIYKEGSIWWYRPLVKTKASPKLCLIYQPFRLKKHCYLSFLGPYVHSLFNFRHYYFSFAIHQFHKWHLSNKSTWISLAKIWHLWISIYFINFF